MEAPLENDLSVEVRELREEIARLREAVANENHPPQLMTTPQCADFLGLGKDIMFEWRKNGEGPPYLHITARTLRYDRDAVFEWAQSHEVK